MAGLMAPLTAGAFFLGGQKQGAFANEIERQKMELAQRQAAVAGRQLVQQNDGTWKIIDLAAPDAVGKTFGTPEDYGKELQAVAASAPPDMQGFVQAALQSGDPNIQRSAYNAVVGRFKMAPKVGASGGNLNADYARAMAENGIKDKSKVSPEMVFKAHQENVNEANARIMARPVVTPYSGTDPMGRPFSIPEVVNKSTRTASPVTLPGGPMGGGAPTTFVNKKMGAADSALIAQMNTILPQLDDLKAKMQAIGPERWNRNLATRQAAYQSMKHTDTFPTFLPGGNDPQLRDMTSQLIQVEATANAALGASAKMRAYNFLKNSKGHIPTASGDFDTIMSNINQLTAPAGPYKSALKAYEMNPDAITGTETSKATPELPPAAMIPEGTKVRFSNGKTYQNINGTVSEANG